MMVVYGDVPSARLLRVPVREVFFTKSRMPLKKWLLLLHCWVRHYPAKDAERWTLTQLVTSTGTFLEVLLNMSIILFYVYRWFREVCSTTSQHDYLAGRSWQDSTS